MLSEPLAALVIACCWLGIGLAAERAYAGARTLDRTAPAYWLVTGWTVMSAFGVMAAIGRFALVPIFIVLGGIGGICFAAVGLRDKDYGDRLR